MRKTVEGQRAGQCRNGTGGHSRGAPPPGVFFVQSAQVIETVEDEGKTVQKHSVQYGVQERGKARRNHREEVGEAVADGSRRMIARMIY